MITDPSPLLCSEDPPTLPPLAEAKQHQLSLEDTIEFCIGDFGWKSIFQATLVSIAWFFDAQQTFISIFTDAEPNQSSCTTDPCQLSFSIISEWSLQCAGSIIKGLPASSFLFGCFVGGFALATLADSSWGRKKALVFSSLVMSLAGALTAFSSNIWMYTLLRFVSGFGRATIGTTALVLATELVEKKWRMNVGLLGFMWYTVGFLSLPQIAFSLQSSSWRLIYLWTNVPSVAYSISLFFLVRESPRWLFIKGRKEEFAETLRSIAAPTNRSSLTQSFFSKCTSWEDKKSPENIFSAAKVFLERGWTGRRLMAISAVAFGTGMIYYGMPFGVGNLSINLYLSTTLNALSEFPASFVALVLVGKLDRKRSVLALCLIGGVCSVSCVVVRWKGVQMGLELVSLFSACTAFDVVLIYTMELFPTCVRNSAVSMVRQALMFGGAVSLILAAAGRKNGVVSFGVFGVAISACAVFVVCLPETRGRVLYDTIEDEESANAASMGA